MSGEWSGGSANYTWHRGRQRDGSETEGVRRVLAEFRERHGWEPGMTWNPYTGAYGHAGEPERHA